MFAGTQLDIRDFSALSLGSMAQCFPASTIHANDRPGINVATKSSGSSQWVLKVTITRQAQPPSPYKSAVAHRPHDLLSGWAYLEDS